MYEVNNKFTLRFDYGYYILGYNKLRNVDFKYMPRKQILV